MPHNVVNCYEWNKKRMQLREDEFNSLVRLTTVNRCSDFPKSTRVTISQNSWNSLLKSNIRKILWKLPKTNSLLASIEFDEIGVEAPRSHQMKGQGLVMTMSCLSGCPVRFTVSTDVREYFLCISNGCKIMCIFTRASKTRLRTGWTALTLVTVHQLSAFSVQFHRVFREWTFPVIEKLSKFQTQLCLPFDAHQKQHRCCFCEARTASP